MIGKILRSTYRILLLTLLYLYYFTSRTILYFLFLFSTVHFAANSSHFRHSIEGLLRSVIPGSFRFERIQIPPYIFNIDILGVSVALPGGREIITADYIGTNINIVKFLNFGRELLFSEKRGGVLEIDLKRIDLHDFKVTLEFDEKGEFLFLSAFVPPETVELEPETAVDEPAVKVKVSLNNIEGVNGSVTIRFPDWGISVEEISLKSKVTIKESGAVEVTASEVKSGGGGFFFKPQEGAKFPLPLNIPLGGFVVEDFQLVDDRFTIRRADVVISKSRIISSGGMAFPTGVEPSFTCSASLEIPAEEPLLYRLTKLSLISPVRIQAQGSGTFSDVTAKTVVEVASLGFEGIPFSDIFLDASIQKEKDEKMETYGKYRVKIEKFSFSSNAGRFSLRDTVIHPFGARGDKVLQFHGRFDFSKLLLPALLKTVLKFARSDLIPVSTLDGAVDFSGEVADGDRKRVKIETEFGIDGNLKKELSFLDGNMVHLKGKMHFEKSLDGGASLLSLSSFTLSSGRDSFTFRGLIIPEEKSISGRFYLRKFLEPLTQRFARLSVPAEIVIHNGSINGTFLNPYLSGSLSVAELSFKGLKISNASAQISLRDWVLGFKGLKGESNLGSFALSGSLKLFEKDDLSRASLSLVIDDFAAERLRLEKFAGEEFRGEFAVKGVDLKADLRRFVESFTGSFSISAPEIAFQDMKFRDFSASTEMTKDRLDVSSFSIRLEQGTPLTGHLTMSRDFEKVNFTISVPEVNLEKLIARDKLPLAGKVTMDLSAKGAVKSLEMKGAISLSDFSYDRFKLGSAKIALSKEPEGNLTLSSDSFFGGMQLNPASSVKFNGGGPESIEILVDLKKLKLFEFVPDFKVKEMEGHLTGSIRLFIGFTGEKRERFRLSLAIPSGGLRLSLIGGEVKYSNKGKAAVEISSEKIQVKNLRLSDGKQELGICGAYYPERKVALNLSGSLGLEFLRMAKSIFSNAEGHISTISVNTGKLLPECAPLQEEVQPISEGLMVFGHVENLIFYGALTLKDASFTFRRFNQEIAFNNGAKIMLEKPFEEGSGFNIIIPKSSKVTGYIGEGAFSLYGSLTMSSFLPDHGELFFEGSDIYYAVPHEFNVIVTPKINLIWSDAMNRDRRKIKLSGSVNINSGGFYKNFDLLKKAFAGAVEREMTRTSPPITEAIPMLADVELDLQITGRDFNINSKLPFGSTDMDTQLDLKVVGTLGDPKFYNRIQFIPGGKLYYGLVKREFEIQKGTVDFNGDLQRPKIDIEAKTEIEKTYISGKSWDSKVGSVEATEGTINILVTLNITGTYPDLKIDLTSNHREYDQTDLQMLILTGMTKKDLYGGGATQLTADSTINILTEDFTNILSNMFLSPLVDAVSFGVDYTGGVNAEVMTNLGKHMKIKTKIAEETIGRRYSAGFQLKITDRLFLEGKIRGFESGVSDLDSSRQYESKLRYRFPLD